MSDDNASILPVEQQRVSSLVDSNYTGMAGDVSTPKCSKMRADIDAVQGDLAAAARKLKDGPPDNVYGLT